MTVKDPGGSSVIKNSCLAVSAGWLLLVLGQAAAAHALAGQPERQRPQRHRRDLQADGEAGAARHLQRMAAQAKAGDVRGAGGAMAQRHL